jgi:hypothetical protein
MIELSLFLIPLILRENNQVKAFDMSLFYVLTFSKL